MSFNEILEECGEFGLYQKFLSFGYLGISRLLYASIVWIQIFILLIPPHRCKLSPDEKEWMALANFSLSQHETNGCHIYQNETITPCLYGMMYDFSWHFPTFSSEQEWVCSASWKMYLAHTCFWLGATFGLIVFGLISDLYGRKRSYVISVLLALLSGIASLCCTEEISFSIARFFSGAAHDALSSTSFTLVMEYTGPNKRRINVFIFSAAYLIVGSVLPWIAYYVHHWKYILIISFIPSVAAVLISFWVPESVCWLLTKGRMDEAVQNVKRMAKFNGKDLDSNYILSKLKEDKNQKQSHSAGNGDMISSNTEKVDATANEEMSSVAAALNILKYPNLRKKMAAFMFIWFIVSVCFNGNILETSHLPFNLYIIYSLTALAEMPFCILSMWTLDKFGRRWTTAGFLFVGGILGIFSSIIDDQELVFISALVVRSCYSAAFDATVAFSNESFPTVIRGTAQTFVRILAGFGNILMPHIVSLAEQRPLLPCLVLGSMAVIGGIFPLLLPETAKQNLPHTLEEGESFGKDQSFLFCPFSQTTYQEGSSDSKTTHTLKK